MTVVGIALIAVAVIAVAAVAVLPGAAGTAGRRSRNSAAGASHVPARSPSEVAVLAVDTSDLPASHDSDPWSLTEWFLSGGRSAEQEEREIQERAATCMRALGWSYEPVVGAFGNDIITLGELRKYRAAEGYGLPDDAPASRDDDPDRRLQTLSPQDRTRYLGDLYGHGGRSGPAGGAPGLPPSGVQGCLHRAERAVRVTMPRYDERIRAYLDTNPVQTLPAWSVAEAGWARCMRARGVAVDDHADLRSLVGRLSSRPGTTGAAGATGTTSAPVASPGTGTPRAVDERTVAVIDVECYVRKIHPVQRAIERALLLRVAERFPSYRDAVEAALR